MSTELEQVELDGMPETPVQVVPLWLHMCELGVAGFASAATALRQLAAVPNLPSGYARIFEQAEERIGRVVMQEVGRVAWEDAINRVIGTWSELRDMAAAMTEMKAKEQE